MPSPKPAPASWFLKTISEVSTLAEELGLDDRSAQRLREFVLSKMKNEYIAGCRSGIKWARENPSHHNA